MGAISRARASLGVALLGLLIVNYCWMVNAETAGKDDTDLVFESLEQSNLHNARDSDSRIVPRDLSEQISPEEEGWISSVVNRIRRSINWYFGNEPEVKEEEHNLPIPEHLEREKRSLKKQPQFGLDPQDLAGQEVYDDLSASEDRDFIRNSSDFNLGFFGDDDDEDLSYSGFHSGGGNVIIPGHEHPVYFRITLTVTEPFIPEYSNRNSPSSQRFSEDFVRACEAIFEKLPGRQNAHIVRIQRREADPFTSKVILDLASEGFQDGDTIQDTLLSHIESQRRIGSHSVSNEDFHFRAFDETHPPHSCDANELTCQNGECVPSTSRCNGQMDCTDGSDEIGCRPPFEPNTTTVAPAITTYPPPRPPPTTTEDTRTIIDEGSGNGGLEHHCRADDVLQCSDGSRTICADHRCDGKEDCANGEDERNCDSDCAIDEFGCDISRCLPLSKRCDGEPDCDDETDEHHCTSCRGILCGSTCLPSRTRCDGEQQCPDGSDEANCPSGVSQCGQGYFSCGNQECIPEYQRCDGVPQCNNRNDEQNCTSPVGPANCRVDQFACTNGQCIPISARCNRMYDCKDQSDELSCPCKPDDFRCNNGLCIPKSKRCDGIRNCQDRSDEIGCPHNRCDKKYEWECDDGQCIDQNSYCDGRKDCADNSDELRCNHKKCKSDEYKCNNGTCLNIAKRCDGNEDCSDGEDEEYCARCTGNQFQCQNGKCVDIRKRCDQIVDCSDNSDEQDCNGRILKCTKKAWRCRDNLYCISKRDVCNGENNCQDGSDEKYCRKRGFFRKNTTKGSTCRHGEFRCTEGYCIEGYKWCNGYPDCPSGNDEYDCPASTTYAPVACKPDQFDCGNFTCIDSTYRCDRFPDCQNGNDEKDCPKLCQEGEFQCISDTTCIPVYLLCDGQRQCPDGSDEEDCDLPTPPPGRRCPSGEFQCASDGQCVPQYYVCNGVAECRDGSDENECPCHSDQFPCLSGECVDLRARCDRRNDCRDGSDEYNCPTEPPFTVPETTTQPSTPSSIVCPPNSQACRNGQCIPQRSFCNGYIDCQDGSDEINCREPPVIPGGDELILRTYPSSQEIKENIYKTDREVVFQCRDEGPQRAHVRWMRANGAPLPPGTRDVNGRLEMPNIRVEHSGTYVCEAQGVPPGTRGSRVEVHLRVDPWVSQPTRPPTACGLQQATCANGDCIPKNSVCDGKYDCTDGSDESRCNPHGCEPNQFRCNNKECILKTWRCDSEADCNDGSDEMNCATNPPGSVCQFHQFACRGNNQCIPKNFHCDMQRDCVDGSDEIGCSIPVISKPPIPMVTLVVGETFTITCTAVGVPVPEISWRLNWGHIPDKCQTTSVGGFGTLTCPNIQVQDQGAYSCEALNAKKSVLAVPDTILIVSGPNTTCPPGYFNDEAQSPDECIKCFCFGQSTQCRSADLFIYQFQPPFDSLRLQGVYVDPFTGDIQVRDESVYYGSNPQLTAYGRNGVHAQLFGSPPGQSSIVPYFAMPENYHGSQLKSYGGYLKYEVNHNNRGYPTIGPDVIITGNGYTIYHKSRFPPEANRKEQMSVRFFEGDWLIKQGSQEIPATRADIMMTLASVDNVLIKLQFNEGQLNTTVSNIVMDSAAAPNSGLGPATYVEQCDCPAGYSGSSCEKCDAGYERNKQGPWLGKCYAQGARECSAGYYGAPERGIPCQICPCPLTNPSNQFARTCKLGPDDDVICECPTGYVGRRCEQCAPGYSGNPMISGDSCKPFGPPPPPPDCNSEGAVVPYRNSQGQCQCKDYVEGPSCDQCKVNSFSLSSRHQFGCIPCFCMGITKQCSSSNWYRDQISSVFTTSPNEFTLVDPSHSSTPIAEGFTVNPNSRELAYANFPSSNVYYWSLPPRYLGDKVSSYGGFLRYTVRHVPLPGGQSSRNAEADVEIVSRNKIKLQYYAKDQPAPSGSAQTFEVPLLEQYWQRDDGLSADRENFLMALADLSAIYIKATYTTNTREVSIISVSMDTATEQNSGFSQRAHEVEQCSCPVGYKGLSCEDCDVGYTKADSGIYLGLCEPCNCNGHSFDCNADTGECNNCRDYTTGSSCEFCIEGYSGDPANGIPCIKSSGNTCLCDERGSKTSFCTGGRCSCKVNVEGDHCDHCRPGTFDLSALNPYGCQSCFCSGVTNECTESNLYVQQIPSQIVNERNHGFLLIDNDNNYGVIDSGFKVNIAMNEIGYSFKPSNVERWYWSLPSNFTGNKITSYGGQLEFTQRYTERPQAQYIPDKDVIIIGNGMTIYWSNSQRLIPDIPNKVAITLSASDNWQRLMNDHGFLPASRSDILTVLSNIEKILVRALLSSDTFSSYISDITLDTAVEQYTGQARATHVETCRCPQGYRGTSCESCSPGYYRDVTDTRIGPLGSCNRCPCNGNEENCMLTPQNTVKCDCMPGFYGVNCELRGPIETTPYPTEPPPTIEPPRFEVIIINPSIEIREVGSSVTFNCSTRALRVGNNPIRIQWNRDGSAMPGTAVDDGRGLLVITDLKVSDSGRYICEAFDNFNIITKDVSLHVGGNPPEIPRITINPPSLDVIEGQPIEFSCYGSGNPQLRIVHVNAPLNSQYTFDSGVFRIQSATTQDSGVYECIGQNSAGSDTESIDVRVRISQLVQVSINPPNYTGFEGDKVTLTCRASGSIQVIKWTKTTGPLPYEATEDNGVLTIPNVSSRDAGTYKCSVTTYEGTSGSQTVVVNIIPSTGGFPTAEVSPEKVEIFQGGSAEIHCIGTGAPLPTLRWTKSDSEFGPNVEQRGSTLFIRNASPSDRGVYLCVSSNNNGVAQASCFVEVLRTEAPVISIYPQPSQTVIAGGVLTIECRITSGIPTPSLTWERQDNLPLSRNVQQTPGSLMFYEVTPQDEGEYVCRAVNVAGSATAVAGVVVHTVPVVRIVPDEKVITKNQGEYLRLECHGTGNPKPSVEWSNPSRYRAVLDSERGGPSYQFGEPSRTDIAIQEIRYLSEQDEGLYICKASNDAGVTERRIQVIVNTYPSRGDIVGNRGRGEDATSTHNGSNPNYKEGNENTNRPYPPPAPTRYDENFTVPVGSDAEIRCRISNAINNQDIIVNWVRADRSPLPEGAYIREGTLHIERVQPDAAGGYICMGTDQGNVVFTLNTYLDVIEPPRVSLHPQRQVVHPGDNAMIQCTSTGQQPITITWNSVGRSIPASVAIRDGYIQFQNIQLSDAGRYRCSAVNSVGEADAVADVIVEENGPTSVSTDRQQTAPIGSSVTLRCKVKWNSPSNSVRWFREHLPLPRNSEIMGDVINLHNVRQEDEGRYFCEISDGAQLSSDYIDLQVTRPRNNSTNSSLHITPVGSDHRAGENLNVQCQSAEPGVITTWSKLSGWLADNVQSVGGHLKIIGLRPENTGIYRCEATGRQGPYHADYYLNVTDDYRVNDQTPLKIERAPVGSMVKMTCKTDLEEPITYHWSKQGDDLPEYVDSKLKDIQLNDIDSRDAGTYTCSANNGQRNIDVPTVLIVTGIVPYFTQAPVSYVVLPTLPDGYAQFNFEISFKPENEDGILLYNGDRGSEDNGDFFALILNNGVPEFKFNLGEGVISTKADRPLTLGKWHTIKVSRNRRKATMFVDGGAPYVANGEGRFNGLDLTENLYLGGIPQDKAISPQVNTYRKFVGCISRLKIGSMHVDILKEALSKEGITSCETCSENNCQNQGVCQEAESPEGYRCICPSSFSGPTCNKLKGEACSPHSCGKGRCLDTDTGFECLCPLGYVGKRCEREIEIVEPGFQKNSYVAYPTLKLNRRLKVTMKIKPRDLSDGILFYSAETEEGHGDFASLAIKDRRLEFRFDVGGGPTIIRGARDLTPNEWVVVTVSRTMSDGRLMVSGTPPDLQTRRSTGNHKILNLMTHLYVGGYDKKHVKINDGVNVNTGFHGCIADISISGLQLDVISSIEDSANVNDCKAIENDTLSDYETNSNEIDIPPTYSPRQTGCSNSPCLNQGQCYPLSPIDYRCACINGYSGRNCENSPRNLCENSPCQYGGTCSGNTTDYHCDCLLGYTGFNCDQRADIRNDVHFNGDGYLEYNRSWLDIPSDSEEIIGIELSTNSSNGLIFWHGQSPKEDGQGQDYVSLGLVDGFLEYSFDLGSGPAIILNDDIQVNNGQRYSVILKRRGSWGSIEINNMYLREGEAGIGKGRIDLQGPIYLGGTPNIRLMTGERFVEGFNGCIHLFQLQESRSFSLGINATSGINVRPCSRYEITSLRDLSENEVSVY